MVLELDYEKYRRRREVELSEEGNLFEAVLRREEIVNKAKEIKVTEQDLIMKELKAISFLGVVSSSSHKKIYLEYRGEICEVVDGKSMDISTKNGKHSVVVSLEEEDLLTIYEPVELLKVNINI
ncbi:hypothetical protein PM10SUCC1_30640 [Propionigenium maris DSM 9537]|uniref:Uncharacterized protein n=1 Tax=Propionigenium maris DSM 9537 TaxID=1123000 RepID=A0A9W6GNU4_9FUSO|nr:hypothetical protein [Propionigenium maris]GLI57550.1 hypothetical protein PM10SUCC1_30640 [Propionigenium maris DSM 9537]